MIITCTCTVIVYNGGSFPLVVLHQVQDGVAEGEVVGVQVAVEGISVVQGVVFPPHLDVGHLQGVADGLHRVGG